MKDVKQIKTCVRKYGSEALINAWYGLDVKKPNSSVLDIDSKFMMCAINN
jgi:hypothetical protein